MAETQVKVRFYFRVGAGLGAIVYLLATAIYLVLHGSWPTPDFLIPPLLLFAVIAGRGWSFLIDWLPFLLLLIVYQSFAGLADDLNGRVHFQELIVADERLFGSGNLPAVLLQERFFRDDQVVWYDWAATFLHAAHFVVPATFGFILWLQSRVTYWRYMLTFMAAFYAGFITYYLYPAAPPWMAAREGLVPPVTRVIIHTLISLPASEPLALFYQHFSPNDVAAMPSLHAAAPALVALAGLALWGWRGLPLTAYPLAGGIAWVYLGEHYVVDVLAGWLYALGAFLVVWILLSRLASHAWEALREWRLQPVRIVPSALPAWPLGALALFLIILVWIDPLMRVPLHPERGPLIPDAGVRPGLIEVDHLLDLDPRDCRIGTSSALALDRELEPLAGQYAAYLLGLNWPTCFSITAIAGIPALTEHELAYIDRVRVARAPERLRLSDEPPGYLTVVQVGTLSAEGELPEGLVQGEIYAVVVRVDTTRHQAEVQQLVAQVARLAFGTNSGLP